MRISSETIGVMSGIDVGSHNRDNCSHAADVGIARTGIFDRFLISIKVLVEYVFGMHVGFAIGWLLGWRAGNIYADSYKPLFFSSLSELRQWRLIPFEVAGYGAVAGVIGGVILVALISSKSTSRNVTTSDENEVIEPAHVAQAC